MNESYAGAEELTIVLFVFGLILFFMVLILLPTIFYLISLQKALSRCRPENRVMQPGLVWLNLIPVFNLVWQFFTVIYVAQSLDNEFKSRDLPCEPEPGKSVGLAMCILNAISIIPYVNLLTGIGTLVCWIMHWVKIADCSGQLLNHPILEAPPVPPTGNGVLD